MHRTQKLIPFCICIIFLSASATFAEQLSCMHIGGLLYNENNVTLQFQDSGLFTEGANLSTDNIHCSSAPGLDSRSILIDPIIADGGENGCAPSKDKPRRKGPDAKPLEENTNLAVPRITALNYPNPFNPVTEISFNLPAASDVKLTVFSLSGAEVAQIANGRFNAGQHAVRFDAAGLPSGIYFYRLNAANQSFTGKMILAK